ncbi:pilus assembly protein PilM [bacterium SCSIO 12696]|nr:pilus assembly protein PilM [bacterium SCSIO 12696]
MGVEIRPDGIAVAQINANPQGEKQLLACEFLPCDADADRAALLRDCICSLGLKGARCHAALPMGSYHLHLTEAPQVPDDELRDAIRWKIQDQIPMPLEEAVIDAFPLPKNTGRSDNVYAVAAATSDVEQAAQIISEAGLKLQSIDINELALRNLASAIHSGQRSIAIALISPGRVCVNVYGDDALYLTRQFDIKWQGGLMEDLPEDALGLELQRSLDYFERQMRQPPPKQVYLCGQHISSDKVGDDLRNSLSTPIDVLDLSQHLPLPAGVDSEQLPLCVAAIGASLRSDNKVAA